MPPSDRRSPGKRLILTLAALASIIVGYYLGQYWQRRPLGELSAVVYPAGQPVEYPADLDIDTDPDAPARWRLFVVANTEVTACVQLLRHYATVFNRLAARPRIQANLRLTVLAYDRPDTAAVASFTGGVGWAEVVSAERTRLDPLSRQLGLLPPGADNWCDATGNSAILVAPDRKRWALIPYEQAAMMARNISTIIAFVE